LSASTAPRRISTAATRPKSTATHSDDVFRSLSVRRERKSDAQHDLYLNGGLGTRRSGAGQCPRHTFGSTYTFSNPFGCIAHVFGLGPDGTPCATTSRPHDQRRLRFGHVRYQCLTSAARR
jgi:hypothetical protein